jgi:hypothetical protein
MLIDIIVQVNKWALDWMFSLWPVNMPILGFQFSTFQAMAETFMKFVAPFETIFPIGMAFMFIGLTLTLNLFKDLFNAVVFLFKSFRIIG